MAAEVLAAGGAPVTVYDRMPSAGRKFLMAGRGGLNLTHSEELEPFLTRYGGTGEKLRPAIEAFPPTALRAWSAELGQSTYVGSSGRVFPGAMKASPLLRAWLRRLDTAGVQLALRHRWTGWDDAKRLTFEATGGDVPVEVDATVLALGGASWPRLGSDGGWAGILTRAGVAISPLKAVELRLPRRAGRSIFGDACRTAVEAYRAVVRRSRGARRGMHHRKRHRRRRGLCALAACCATRSRQTARRRCVSRLRPDIWPRELERRFAAPRGKQSMSTFLRKVLSLSPVEIALLQEATSVGAARHDDAARARARLINAVPIRLTGVAPIARAISTAGGVPFDALDAHFMLRRLPGVFVAGEMLDWEAPTGGYLLQACFATGAAAARGALHWLGPQR